MRERPSPGKQVLDILSLALDDRGDIAMLARCADGTGIWSGAKNAWVAFTGESITSGEGFPSPIKSLEGLSLGPKGEIHYIARYQAANPKTHLYTFRIGFFSDGKLVYETPSQEGTHRYADGTGGFLPDGRAILGEFARPGGLRIGTGDTVDQPVTPLAPAPPEILSLSLLTINPSTGHYVYWASYNAPGNQPRPAVFLNNVPRVSLPANDTPAAIYLNGKDDIAFSLNSKGNRIFIDGRPTPETGALLGFNDAQDLLRETWNPPADPVRRVRLNDSVVIEPGNYTTYGPREPLRLGVPQMKERGFVYGYKLARLNNRGQVAFAAQFVPVGTRVTLRAVSGVSVLATDRGVPVLWVVMLASPRN